MVTKDVMQDGERLVEGAPGLRAPLAVKKLFEAFGAGQRVLDATGNLKAVQALLGHASISATADTYTDWDIQLLESSLLQTLAAENDGE